MTMVMMTVAVGGTAVAVAAADGGCSACRGRCGGCAVTGAAGRASRT